MINACSTLATKSSEKRERALRIGMGIHSLLVKEKKRVDMYVENCLVDMYCKCGELEEARRIFDSMPRRDAVSYNTIIHGCGSNGQPELALDYYSALRADDTVQPNDRTHVAVISACSALAAESSEKRGRALWRSALQYYSALRADHTVQPNDRIHVAVISACSILAAEWNEERERALRIGMEIHSILRKEKKQLDMFVANCLVDMYCKCGELEEAFEIFESMGTRDVVSYNAIIHGCGLSGKLEKARKMFGLMPRRDVLSYNAIIQGCCLNGQPELALEYYSALRADTTIQPDASTCSCVLVACGSLMAIKLGREIHQLVKQQLIRFWPPAW